MTRPRRLALIGAGCAMLSAGSTMALVTNGLRHRSDAQRLWVCGIQPAPGVRGIEVRPD